MATATRTRTNNGEQAKPKAKPQPPKAKPKSDGLPTGKAREQLARRVIKMREQGLNWGDIKAQTGIKTAPHGRKLMREFGAGDQIAPSYDRDEAKAQREAADKNEEPVAS
jgi:hypothetical protein